jgi:hypothetical protein
MIFLGLSYRIELQYLSLYYDHHVFQVNCSILSNQSTLQSLNCWQRWWINCNIKRIIYLLTSWAWHSGSHFDGRWYSETKLLTQRCGLRRVLGRKNEGNYIRRIHVCYFPRNSMVTLSVSINVHTQEVTSSYAGASSNTQIGTNDNTKKGLTNRSNTRTPSRNIELYHLDRAAP